MSHLRWYHPADPECPYEDSYEEESEAQMQAEEEWANFKREQYDL